MPDIFKYTQVPPSVIKGICLSKCKRHHATGRSLTVYRKNGHQIYEAFWRRFIMIHLAYDTFDKTSQDQKDFETFCYIMENDLDRVITDAAVYTWLCTEGDSIKDKIKGDIAIPSKLYSGLVLKYYEPTIRIAAFHSELSYTEELATIDKRAILAADDYAWTCLLDKLPSINMTEKEAKVLVRRHILNRTNSLERV